MRRKKTQGFFNILSVFVLVLTISSLVVGYPSVSHASDITQQTADSWFSGLTDSQFTINVTEDSNPPTVTIPPGSTSSRPQIVFKLFSFVGEGANGTQNTKWLLFQAYQADSSGNLSPINNLFLTADDNNNAGHVLYVPSNQSQSPNDIVSNINNYIVDGYGITGIGSVKKMFDDTTINNIFGYLMNVPKGTDDGSQTPNCADKNVYTVGPSGADGKTVQAVQDAHNDAFNGAHASEFNANCENPSGWAAQWGIQSQNAPLTSGNCSLTLLFATKDLSTAFSGLVSCIFDSLFKPIVIWAAGFVEQAAGVSWLPPDYKLALIERCHLS